MKIPKTPQQKNDRNGDADQPEYETATHCFLLFQHDADAQTSMEKSSIAFAFGDIETNAPYTRRVSHSGDCASSLAAFRS